MNDKKQRKNNYCNRRDISFVRIDSLPSNNRHSYLSGSSSEESLPIDAPLARQPSCSFDIDTVPPVPNGKIQINGITKHPSTYLDNAELRESIQDIE